MSEKLYKVYTGKLCTLTPAVKGQMNCNKSCELFTLDLNTICTANLYTVVNFYCNPSPSRCPGKY